ncbi:Glu/Leu/Phe/Val dehydrogenase dimerization domain-containing protein [Glaciecola sp. 1036]|uniref:Glu/Leu/Phe/Val dehydrogenase dimerization domain-containing protein n=1 Tax=Alteromonadaceae TaxID=72275 RepID=UPI003CFE60E9
MAVFEHPDFDKHEQVAFFSDKKTGLKAIIAVHNTNLGPSLGGCRMWPYENTAAALKDVLRLSKGMTYKAAMAGLPQGGGKAVIIGDPRQHKTPDLMRAMGDCVNKLNGSYIIAEDSGISVSDINAMGERTPNVAGNFARFSLAHETSDGNPAPATAYGVFCGIKAAVAHKLSSDLKGKTVAIQGIGHVGLRLARHLHQAGAKLIVADIFEDNVQLAHSEFGAQIVAVEQIHQQECDVFAPCALGGAINEFSIDQIKAPIVAGAANNQLADKSLDLALVTKNITYVPDYVINAGGIIDIYYQRDEQGTAEITKQKLEAIGDTVQEILVRANKEQRGTEDVANELAEQRFIN